LEFVSSSQFILVYHQGLEYRLRLILLREVYWVVCSVFEYQRVAIAYSCFSLWKSACNSNTVRWVSGGWKHYI